jgi:hypothetical protein
LAQEGREVKLIEVVTASLPDALRDALMKVDDVQRGTDSLPELLQVGRIDLNGDRVNEFIVHSTATYSGGPYLLLYQQRKDKFVHIADSWGSLYFGPRVNGYLQIVSQSRGGAGAYVRQLQQFVGGEYRAVRVADYQSDEDEVLRFVSERSAADGFAPVRHR